MCDNMDGLEINSTQKISISWSHSHGFEHGTMSIEVWRESRGGDETDQLEGQKLSLGERSFWHADL